MSDKASEDLSYSFATIDQIYDDGITLIFDGEETASEKHYKCNSFCIFAPGQRVRVIKDSGTYVVEYPVGNPNADAILPAGGSDGQVLTKDGNEGIASKWADMKGIPTGGTKGQLLSKRTDEPFDVEWAAASKSYIPSGGSSGQMLVKDGSVDYSLKWTDAPVDHIPDGGSNGQLLAKNGSVSRALKWVDAPTERIPAGGTDGQMLVKNGTSNYALKWADAPENHIPTGGNVGQALIKASTSNYALEWGSPTVSRLYQGSTNYAEINSSRAFVPHTAGSRTYPYYLGTSSVPWYGIYTGDGASRICGSSGTLGFYGQTPIARQTLSLSSNNMSYTSVTANNYLYALNNLIGILKNKLGLIK